MFSCHVATIPGLVILLLAIGINLVGDGLRNVLDPKLKSGGQARVHARTAAAVSAERQKRLAPAGENARFGVIAEICDSVNVMYGGRIVESGAVAKVLASPRHPYTQRLLACAPELGQRDRAILPIEGLPPAANALPRGCAFAPRCDLAEARCRNQEIELIDLGEGHLARCVRAAPA